ncbi:MAG TPA: glycosyltransferase [Usitatibacter sp.]|nr:glycosyltransferase [Usitatibacter sp.]
MRVLFVISDLGFHGAQKQVVELSRELDRSGHEVAIYTLNDDVGRARELEGTGVEVIADQKRVKLDPRVLLRLRRKITQWKADIVHGFLFDGDIYARIAAAGTRATVLNSERSDNYEISRSQKLAHWLTKGLVHGVVANSRSGSAFAQKLYGYDPRHMHVVWNGMRVEELERRAVSDHDYRREFFGEGDHRVVCMIGHIKPAKDYHLALDTAAAVLKLAPEWRVLFLGDSLGGTGAYEAGRDSDTSGYKRSVMEHFHKLGLPAERVVFAGARSDAPAILAQCDVQLMTSCREGFPNVVLEGMVLGVPVVSTEYSDIRHILPRASQVITNRSADALAKAIAGAYLDREAIASEQKRWVRAHASIETATRELERVYARYVRPDARALAA